MPAGPRVPLLTLMTDGWRLFLFLLNIFSEYVLIKWTEKKGVLLHGIALTRHSRYPLTCGRMTAAKVFSWVVVPVILFLSSLYTFPLDPAKQISQYTLDTWGLEQGLPQNSIHAMLQDKTGYLWLGTQEGLVRFDGDRFTVYDSVHVKGLDSNYINGLCEDRHGNLWIATRAGGVSRLSRDRRTFTKLDRSNGLSSNTVNNIYEARNGDLWLGTIDGPDCLRNNRPIPFEGAETLAGIFVNAICEDYGGTIWFATSGSGLKALKDGKVSSFTTSDGLLDNDIQNIYVDSRGQVWIGTLRGLNRWLPESREFACYTTRDGLSHLWVRAILEDSDKNLWVGTYGGGLNRMEPGGSFSSIDSSLGLSNNQVWSLCEDAEKNLWIGTRGGGLNRLRNGKFTSYSTAQGLSLDLVWVVCQDRNGGMWFGTDGGVDRMTFKDRGFDIESYAGKTAEPGQNRIIAICEDRANGMWFGTMSGVKYMEPGGRTFSAIKLGEGQSNQVTCITEDSRGHIWVGSMKGLHYLAAGREVVKTYSRGYGLGSGRINFIHEDGKQGLWIGTEGGLSRLNLFDERITSYSVDRELTGRRVFSIYEDGDGYIWLGTSGGLNRLKDGTFGKVTIKNGLFNNVIYSILEDAAGNFWMSCNKGIFRTARPELNAVCDGLKDKIHCISYDEADGMISRECNGGQQPAAWKSKDGRLWFPTIKGAVVIDPLQIPTNHRPPPVVIEEIVAGNRSIPLLWAGTPEYRDLRFPPGTRQFEIRYTGISFPVPDRVLFRYKLEGFDEGWNDVGTRRTAYYAKLPPGKYTFRVSACNNDGTWNETGAALSFYLEPHFYRTTWFYLLCALVTVILSWGAYRTRVRRLKGRAEELRLLVEQRTRDLKEAKDTAEQANRAKSKFLANMSHEIRTPMNAVLGLTEIMGGEISDERHAHFLETIASSGNTLLGLINDILDLSRIEAGKMKLHREPARPRSILNEIKHIFTIEAQKKGLDFFLETGGQLPEALLLDGLRLRQVLLNLVGNAVKFTHEGSITLTARLERPGEEVDIVFQVKDTGIGIPRRQQTQIFEPFEQQEGQNPWRYEGTGLGLAITRKLVELMGGEISVRSSKGKGSTFEVLLKDIPVVDASHAATQGETGVDPEAVCFEKALVLIVDDKEWNRRILMEYLTQSPLEFMEAQNGKEAVDIATNYRPDLILMDVKMPVMDGIEATGILKKDEELKHIPIVIITASVLKEQQEEIRKKAGGDGFLIKPTTKRELISEIMPFLNYSSGATASPKTGAKPDKKEPHPEQLSPEAPAQLRELLDILRSTPFTQRWERLRNTLIVDELESFLHDLKHLAEQHHSGIISEWAANLSLYIRRFDPMRIKEVLSSLPEILEKLAHQIVEFKEIG